MTPLYIVETIHTCEGADIVTRYPTLFFPEEAMDERTIRILAGLYKPFDRHAAEYALYRIEGHEKAGQWRLSIQTAGQEITAVWEPPFELEIASPTEPVSRTYCPVPT